MDRPAYYDTEIVDQLGRLLISNELTDMKIVEAVRETTMHLNSVVDLGDTVMTVVVGRSARLLGCGYPGGNFSVLIERRADGRVTPFVHPNKINSIAMRSVLTVMERSDLFWTEDFTLQALLTLISDRTNST